MGCVLRKSFASNENRKPNIFKVINIDQEGNCHLPGKIEVTSDDLLLYQKKRQTISWPIKKLRRYGYDDNIFSFESGRRCPTGEGIFAFRCEQAEQLFTLLQNSVQMSNHSTGPIPIESGIPNVFSQIRRVRLENVGTILVNNNSTPSQNVESSRSENVYITSLDNVCRTPLESAGSTGSFSSTPISPQLPVYTNNPVNRTPKKDSKDNVCNDPVYINVSTNIPDGQFSDANQDSYIQLPRNGKPCSVSLNLWSCTDEFSTEELKNLEYITLQLNSKPPPLLKTSVLEDEPPGYTRIDFEKTWALMQSTKPNIENDIGCTRRTRHNSTLFGVHTPQP